MFFVCEVCWEVFFCKVWAIDCRMILKFLFASCLARDAIAGFGSPDKNACPSGDVATSCKGRYPMSEGFWLQCVVQNAICKCVRMCVCGPDEGKADSRAFLCAGA